MPTNQLPDLAGMRARASRGEWFRVQAKEDESLAEVFIYDVIGEDFWGEGVSAKAFSKDLAALDAETIRVFINSPGGAAWDGIAIMNALLRHKARVEVVVDGLAASAASVIAMAGDHVTMARGSELMIHEAWGFVMGNAKDMTDTSAVLGKLSDSIADTYAAKAGGDRAAWRERMQAETWYTAEEAVTAGLADEWVDAPAAEAHFDLHKLGFAFMGRAAAPGPRVPVPQTPDSTEPGEPNRKESAVVYDAFKAGLAQRLGVTEPEASDDVLLAAVDEALNEQVDTPSIPDGTTLIDSGVLASLQSDAAAGRAARDEQDKARREGIVKAALDEGRITVASREVWRASLDENEETATKLLASLPAGIATPVEELGHQVEMNDADQIYAAAWPESKGA